MSFVKSGSASSYEQVMVLAIILLNRNFFVARFIEELFPFTGDFFDVPLIWNSQPLHPLDLTVKGTFEISIGKINI